MLLLPLLLFATTTTTTVGAAHLAVHSPQFTISTPNATIIRSESISLTKRVVPLTLSPTDTLKLTFQVVTKEDGKGVQPHQTFLRFFDATNDEEGIQPVRVTSGGKAKFELNMARPPSSLPPTKEAPLQVTLLLGSFKHAPEKIDLFDLHVPASHPPPVHPEEASFHPLPPIAHTFRPEQVLPPKFISAVFAGAVLTPWVVLLALWSTLRLNIALLTTPSIFSFVALLGAFEALLVWYWVDLKLGQVLLYGAILGAFTAPAGRQALRTIGKRRLSRS